MNSSAQKQLTSTRVRGREILARLECRLQSCVLLLTVGQFQEAEVWFKKAILIDDKKRQAGIDDPDVKPFWGSMSGTVWRKETAEHLR